MNVHSPIDLYCHTSCERQIARPVPFCLRVNEWELLTQERMGSRFFGGTLLVYNKKLSSPQWVRRFGLCVIFAG
jgi:hypothetical protein